MLQPDLRERSGKIETAALFKRRPSLFQFYDVASVRKFLHGSRHKYRLAAHGILQDEADYA